MRRTHWRQIKNRACRIVLHSGAMVGDQFFSESIDAVPIRCMEMDMKICGRRACTVRSFEFKLACGKIGWIACFEVKEIFSLPPIPCALPAKEIS